MPNPGTGGLEYTIVDVLPPTTSRSFRIGQKLLRFWNDYKKYIILLISIVALFLIGQRFFVYLLGIFFEWVEAIGIWGNFLFVLMFLIVSFPIILGGKFIS
jgi:hypothetical protein